MNLDERLDFLKRLNRVRISGKPVYDHFLLRGVSLYTFNQERIFGELEDISAEKWKKAQTRQSRWMKGRLFFLLFVALILSIVSAVVLLLRRGVMVYTEDVVIMPERNDRRIGKIYAFLRRNSLGFGEFVHMRINGAFIRNFLHRRRPVLFLESIDLLNWLYFRVKGGRWHFGTIEKKDVDLHEFSESEKELAWTLLLASAQKAESTRFKVLVLARVFRLLGMSKLLMIDDARYHNELILAAKIAGVQSVAFQHASFTKYYVGLTQYNIPSSRYVLPDLYCVWNEYWRAKLLSLNPAIASPGHEVVVSGKPTDTVTNFKMVKKIEDDICTVLVPYELGHHGEVAPYIRALLKCPDTEVIFKLRKDHPANEQIAQFGLQDLIAAGRCRVVSDISDDEMARIDVVVGTSSTILSEMMQAGKPVGILKSQNSFAEELVADGLADPVTEDGRTMCKQIHDIVETPPSVLETRSEILSVHADIEQVLEQLFGAGRT